MTHAALKKLLAENIRRRRTTMGLTQSELAEMAEVSQPTIAHLETTRYDPSFSTLFHVASALRTDVSQLLS